MTCVAACFMAATMCNADTVWTDVTKRLMTNPTFDNNSSDGWTWEATTGTVGAAASCLRFYNGTCTFSQQLKNLPKGTYRLSVQGFYRAEGNGYDAHKNGTENITAYLYAGSAATKLVSVYSEGMTTQGAGNWQYYDGLFYPDNSSSASAAFDAGLYKGNAVEFQAEGSVTVGVRCTEGGNANYCVLDNFRLEYYGEQVKATSVTLTADRTELFSGEQTTISATIKPDNALLTWLDWTSSNERVATVDQNGTVTALSSGTAVITATATDGSGVKGTITISVVSTAATEGSLVINEIMASNVDEFISPAFNFDGWIELYNPTDRPVELSGISISDPVNGAGPWKTPLTMGVVPAKGYGIVWFDSNDIQPNNAPFKLDTDGGTIVIAGPDGKEIARQAYPASLERISYARGDDGHWAHTGTPTPGAANTGLIDSGAQLAAPVVDQPSQLFMGTLSVNVTIPGGCTLRYTTDGTLPTLTNGITSRAGQFRISRTSNYRFRLFANDMLPSRVTSRSYIYRDANYTLPVVSVVTDPDFLYSREIGVFEQGPNGRPGNGVSAKCNWNMNWERPVNFSYLDTDGEMVLNQDVNLEMCGGWSRAWQPHAFKLKGNKEMGGDKNLPYPFFEQKPYIRNRTLQIRNGGNDNWCRFKDPSLQYIVQTSGLNVDCQSYQPVHEFINGQYIGVLNVREPNNKHYVYANYGWDDDVIDQFEMSPDSGYVQKCGTPDAFNELVDVLSPNAANSDTYAEICRMLDIDAYANYMAAQLYLGNWDWPQNNVKGFRYRDGGKFRFVLFDLDGSFSTDTPFNTFSDKEYYTFDQLMPASLGRHYNEHIRFVTLFKNMLKNDDFRRHFIDAYCIMGGSVLQKDRASQIIDKLLDRVEPAMNINWSSASSTANDVRSRLNNRLNTASSALRNYADMGLRQTTRQTVALNSDTEGAKIYINGLEVPTGQFNGHLFAPVKLRAQAPAGYAFKAWVNRAGTIQSTNAEVTMPSGTVQWTATFTPLSDSERRAQGITPVRINEVSGSNDSYIDEYGKKGDWVELYNTTDSEIDVEGMYLTDNVSKPTKWQITKGDTRARTTIPPHGYLVIWCDNKRATTDGGLHATFKIDGDGGQVAIMAADRSWGDVLTYGAHDAATTVGRFPDGSADVYATNVATIGTSNIMTSYMTPVDQQHIDVSVRPISAANGLRICYGAQQLLVKSDDAQRVSVSIYRTDGILADQASLDVSGHSARLSVESLQPGLYIARATGTDGTTVSCKFMK